MKIKEKAKDMRGTATKMSMKEVSSKTKPMGEESMHGNQETSMKGNGSWVREVARVLGEVEKESTMKVIG